MDKEMEIFKTNIDSWIKQIRSEYTDILDMDLVVSEHTDNIQHNYELIHELREEVEELKRELNMMKVLHMMAIKGELKSNF